MANPDISIIIPTWNEAESISGTLEKICTQLKSDALSHEILVMDDNSSDGTEKIVSRLTKKYPEIKFIAHAPPRSFGYSLRDGIKMARGKMAVIMMADLSDDPAAIRTMWEKYRQGYDFIVGSRFIKDSVVHDYPFLKMVSNRMFNIAVMIGFFTGIRDTSNNFKAFDAEKAKAILLDSKGFEVGAELMLRMLIKKARICEIPVSWSDRTGGMSKFKLHNTFIKYFLLFLRMLKLAYFGKRGA